MRKRECFTALACVLVAVATSRGAWRAGLVGGKTSGAFNVADYPAETDVYLCPHAATNNDTTASGVWYDCVNTTWVYTGQVYLAGATTFAENIDDSVLLLVGGTQILNNSVWNMPTYGTFTPEAPGWHSFELRMGNGSGGAGPVAGNGWTATKGFGMASGTNTSTQGGDYVVPADPGDISLFRYDDGLGFDDGLVISGDPSDYGTVSPPYGTTNGLVADDAFLCSAPTGTLDVAAGIRAQCVGYTLYTNETVLVASGATNAFWYVHERYTRLVWQWRMKYEILFTAGTGGTVDRSGGWFDEGTHATVNAIPDDGRHFAYWTGDVPKDLARAAALSVPADQPRAVTAVFGRMLYVAPSGADGNDGTSWASPLLTIARAVEVAGAGDTIAVSNGTYEITAQIRVSKGATIRGIGSSPDDVVIKRKSNNVRIFELDHANARIENLTVSGGIITGTSGKGGNILIASGGGAVVGCIIRDGVITSGWSCIGAGVHVASDAGLVSGCLIVNNYTKDFNSDGGAGLSMEKGRVVNCIIAGNAQHATSFAGTRPTGAVRMTGGELIHCTITRNQMYGGTAGVYATGGKVVNCIIAGNFALPNTAAAPVAAAPVYAGTAACFENCVSDAVLINSSCFQEEVDFADPYGSDWRLQAGSVCIDNSIGVEALPGVDVAGNPRIRGAAPDIGAVERQADAGLDAGFAYAQRKPHGVGEVDFTAAVSGAAGSVDYTWDFGDGSAPVSGGSGAVSHTYDEPGVFLVTLTASDGGPAVSATRTVYVRGDAIRVVNTGNPNAVRPYATWETACGSIEEALAFADDGATVLLTNGIHKVLPPCEINKPVTLRGVSGVPGDVRVQRDTSVNCTTFYLNHKGAVLSGLTVESGYNASHQFGGGVLINNRGGTVTNCIVRNCTVMAVGANGGGIFLRGPGLVTHSVITGNKADDNSSKGGCGIAMEAAGRIENCLIAGNVTTLAMATVGREDQKAAGGVYMTAGSLVNCTIVDNRSLNVGGVYLTGGAVTNCIISGNTSEGTKGGATAKVYDGDAAHFVNCASADLLINATCVFGDMAFAPGFTLSPASVALDAGIVPVGGLAPLDLAGNQRISANGLVDAGCYELQDGPLSVAFIVADGEGSAPFNTTFTARARNETGAVTFTWDFGDGTDPCVTAAAETSHTYAVPGDYTVTVTASDGAATAAATRTGLIAVRPRTLYVSDGNPNASVPYDSWDCAAAKVETACAYAVDGCTVLVAPGSYRLASEVVLTRGIALIGATGKPGEVVIGRGTSNIRPFTLNHEGALLSAITVENGNNGSGTIGGGNVLITSGGGTVSNCILRNAKQIGAGRTSAGSGLYVGSPKGLATHCVITNNTCDDHNSAGGAGVFMSAGRVENCLIAFNSQDNAQPNNLSAKGGARVDGGTLVNCTVVSNALWSVGGIYSGGGDVVNCVIARNRSKTTATEAANVNGNDNSSRFVNCATEAFYLNDTCVIGPLHFAGSEAGNFRLLSGSVAIDAGAMDVGGILFGTDLDGKPRVEHGIIDIGCYETTWLPPATMLLVR